MGGNEMEELGRIRTALRYHQRTMHDFGRYAASLGWMDWATQPDPLRRYEGAPTVALPYRCGRPDVPFEALYGRASLEPAPLSVATLGDLLRHALGLSAWKSHGHSRWALRVNPSSGNLHPTEGFVVVPALDGLSEQPSLCHYAPDRHVLERRADLPEDAFRALVGDAPDGSFAVVLTSIPWREAWKYGERAFRYCQHDCGHAIAALSFSAARLGWRLEALTRLGHDDLVALLGLGREDAFAPDEPEEPEVALRVVPRASSASAGDASRLALAMPSATWHGRANRLSRNHAADWTVIDEVARATRPTGLEPSVAAPRVEASVGPEVPTANTTAESVILTRRSAVAFDGESGLGLDAFVRMLRKVMPGAGAPWEALPASGGVHLLLFVHRVHGLAPGLYLLARRPGAHDDLRARTRPELAWAASAAVPPDVPLFMLAEGDCREAAAALSCGQDIGADSAFAVAMLAELSEGFSRQGAFAYRTLHWEAGAIGQVLYLEAELAGLRATGIGCFFDPRVHDLLGLHGPDVQVLYHLAVGGPLDDPRLGTDPGYPDEPAR